MESKACNGKIHRGTIVVGIGQIYQSIIPVHAISRMRVGTDGYGLRTLVVVSGCPLECRYCLNPLTKGSNSSRVMINAEKLYDYLKIDDLYFQMTGGGITFGGGEPALYSDFIADFHDRYCGKWSINMETSANVPTKNIIKLIPVVDRFFIDIKSWNPDTYREYTGCDNDKVVSNLKLLTKECPEKVKIRIPLIPGYNDEKEQAETAKVMEQMGFEMNLFEYTLDVNDFSC